MSVCKQSNVKYGFMTANQLMQKRENVFYISTGSSQVDELLRT
jgi:RecA/RadA recombinase